MDTPAVTIVVPVFGTEDYLGACLESILRQSFRDFEVIVVDDGSPGDVEAIVRSFASFDTRVRLVRNAANQGVMRARLTGAHSARGEYLAFVDPDDEVEDDFLLQLHRAAEQQHADVVDCAFVLPGPDTRVVNRGGDDHLLEGVEILRGLLAGSMSNSLCKLIRLDTWRRAMTPLERIPERISFGEDLLCLVHLAAHSERFAHTSRPAYRYLVREGSVTNARDDVDGLLMNLTSLDATYSLVRAALDEQPVPPELVEQFLEREFLSVGRDILLRISNLPIDHPAGLPPVAASLGLLGAVAVSSLTAGSGAPT